MACKRFFEGIFCCIVPCATNNRDDDVDDDFYDVNRELENQPNRDNQPALVEPEKVDGTKGYLTVTDEEEITTESTTNQEETVEISANKDDGIDEVEAKVQELDEESSSSESDLYVCPTILPMENLNNVEKNETNPDEPVNEDSEDSASLDTFGSDETDPDFELEDLEEDLVKIKFQDEISSSASEPSSQPSCCKDEQSSKPDLIMVDGETSEHSGNCDVEEVLDPPDFIQKSEKNRKTVRFDYLVKCRAGNADLRLPLCIPSKVFCTDDEESDEDDAETTDDHPGTSQLASELSVSQDYPGPSSASRLRSRLGQISLQYSDSGEGSDDTTRVEESPVSSSPLSEFQTSGTGRLSVSSPFQLSAEYSTSEESPNEPQSEDSVFNSSTDLSSTTSPDSGTETSTIDDGVSSCPSPATSSSSNTDSGVEDNSPPDDNSFNLRSRNRLRGRLSQLSEHFANCE